MTELSVRLLLDTATASVRDVICSGGCRHSGPAECAASTFLVFPYRGVYVRHVGRHDSVAEGNQVVFFNKGEDYSISHPIEGGDACLSVGVAEHWLRFGIDERSKAGQAYTDAVRRLAGEQIEMRFTAPAKRGLVQWLLRRTA